MQMFSYYFHIQQPSQAIGQTRRRDRKGQDGQPGEQKRKTVLDRAPRRIPGTLPQRRAGDAPSIKNEAARRGGGTPRRALIHYLHRRK